MFSPHSSGSGRYLFHPSDWRDWRFRGCWLFFLSFFPNRGFRTAALIRANYSGVVRLARTDCPAGVAAVNTQKEHETESDHGTATSTIFILLF